MRLIKKGALISALILFTVSAAFPAEKKAEQSPEMNKAEILAKTVQKTLTGITNIVGQFKQTSFIKDLESTQEFTGTFYIKKPDNIMWQYKTPRDEKIVIRGTDTWMYKKLENQVIHTKFTKDAYTQIPIALLTGMENIMDDFDISMAEENSLQLIPKKRMGFVKALILETSLTNFPVIMFTILDTYGNVIMVELTDVQINPGLDDALFQFEIPEGAEVYDLSQ
ncbi:outer membrane lipoprotein carrier protein LolA [bacterium]|nr:outer membrane lipoprotein carrier protein LolA [bacterium]